MLKLLHSQLEGPALVVKSLKMVVLLARSCSLSSHPPSSIKSNPFRAHDNVSDESLMSHAVV